MSLPLMLATTSRMPPPSVCDSESGSTFQPVALGVAGVHAEEVGREERGLVAAGAGADLEDRVLLVVRVLGDEQQPDLRFELRALLREASSISLARELLTRRRRRGPRACCLRAGRRAPWPGRAAS